MRYMLLTVCLCALGFISFAQTDSTQQQKVDTIRIGGMIIIKKSGSGSHGNILVNGGNKKQKNSNITTSYWIFDLGFANWTDKTNYAAATAENVFVNRPGSAAISANDFKLKTGKSSNVNIWFFMQRLNLVKHAVNLKYGLGLEMNNYRFSENISFKPAGPRPYSVSNEIINHPFVFRDSIAFSKNKLAADYITVPMMINFQTNPNSHKKGLGFSAGVSVGYLYASRNKQKSSERGKQKNRGNYDLERWKLSYVGEMGLGPVRLYGSYTPKSIFENSINLVPYTVGIRFSNW